MKNIEYIKKLNDEELAEYIQSVYICGVLAGKGELQDEELEDYIEWLNKDYAKQKL